MSDLISKVDGLLQTIQKDLFAKALNFRDSHITEVEDIETFKKVLVSKTGFISAHWDGTTETELKIKELTKATIRCIPSDVKNEEGKCVFTGKPSSRRVLFAKAY
jgi:prolyl-tRNA synthetase